MRNDAALVVGEWNHTLVCFPKISDHLTRCVPNEST
jgi:hypothetical protein